MEQLELYINVYYTLSNVTGIPVSHLYLKYRNIQFIFEIFSLVTSRKPRDDEKDGQAYRFVSRAEMEMDIKAGRYLEHGEYEGNLYGTKIDSILEVVQTGRTCILDVNPQVYLV